MAVLYKSDLNWMKEMGTFSDEEQKVLLVLSHQKYSWRTKERIAATTGLTDEQLNSVLAGLIEKEYIRPSFSKNKNLIFGLTERVR